MRLFIPLSLAVLAVAATVTAEQHIQLDETSLRLSNKLAIRSDSDDAPPGVCDEEQEDRCRNENDEDACQDLEESNCISNYDYPPGNKKDNHKRSLLKVRDEKDGAEEDKEDAKENGEDYAGGKGNVNDKYSKKLRRWAVKRDTAKVASKRKHSGAKKANSDNQAGDGPNSSGDRDDGTEDRRVAGEAGYITAQIAKRSEPSKTKDPAQTKKKHLLEDDPDFDLPDDDDLDLDDPDLDADSLDGLDDDPVDDAKDAVDDVADKVKDNVHH